jgi:hypothetical protein
MGDGVWHLYNRHSNVTVALHHDFPPIVASCPMNPFYGAAISHPIACSDVVEFLPQPFSHNPGVDLMPCAMQSLAA